MHGSNPTGSVSKPPWNRPADLQCTVSGTCVIGMVDVVKAYNRDFCDDALQLSTASRLETVHCSLCEQSCDSTLNLVQYVLLSEWVR